MVDRVLQGEDMKEVLREETLEEGGLRDLGLIVGGIIAGRTLFKRSIHSSKDAAAALMAVREWMQGQTKYHTRTGILTGLDYLTKQVLSLGEEKEN